MVLSESVANSSGLNNRPILEFRNIGLEYVQDGHVMRIIKDVSFSMRHAEFVSIVGPSGCGKTSLLRMVSGLNPPKIGTIHFRGELVTKPVKGIGIAFQNPVMLPWRNTLKNVMLPLEVSEPYKRNYNQNLPDYTRMAQELLASVGLLDFQTRYPWQLSGGMRQRASLCRALIHQPELLLFDEPFGALDAFTREEMWVMVQELWTKLQFTGMLITHDLREAIFLSDTVYVMGPRPSEFIYELKVNLPRPRTIEMCLSDEFNHLFSDVRRHIRKN